MTRTQRRWRFALLRRKAFLERRIASGNGRDLSFDKGEVAALRFAVACIDAADAAGVVAEGTGKVTLQERLDNTV